MNIEDIRKVVQEESQKTRDELRGYIKTGFETLDKKIDLVDTNLSNKIDGINNRLDDQSLNKVGYDNFNPIVKRVDLLEKEVGI